MRRKRARKDHPVRVPGLRWRDGAAYWEREHARLPRLAKSLATRDPQLAAQYAGALNTLMDRGDWHVLERWRTDEVHITDIVRAVREGDYQRLRKLSIEGTRLGDAVDRFLRRSEATLKAKTAEQYRSVMGLLLEHYGRDYPMAQLTTEQAEAFLHAPKASAGGRVWSASTMSAARTRYKALWSMVIDEEAEAAAIVDADPHVIRNPWRRTKVPKVRQTRVVFLSPEQWRTLITHDDVVDTPQAAMLGVCCLAGLRQQEAAHLRTEHDIDFDAGLVRVQDRKGDDGWTAKHEHSVRDVPMVPELRRLLERHYELGYPRRYVFRPARRGDGPIRHTTVIDWVRSAFSAAGIRYGRTRSALTAHSLRHTFGTWMAQDGVPFHVIAELMGNTAAEVIRTYAHHAPHDLAKAMESIASRAG